MRSVHDAIEYGARKLRYQELKFEQTKDKSSMHIWPQETHTLCVFDRLPVVSWRRAKYKQMYGLKSTLTVSR